MVVDADRVKAEAVDHDGALGHTELGGEGGEPGGDVAELRAAARHVEGTGRGGVAQRDAAPALVHPGVPAQCGQYTVITLLLTRRIKIK